MSTKWIIKWIIILLAVLNFGFMAFDGSRALVKGDYIRPSQGQHAGQLGHALEVGASLKEISHAASEMAIKLALEREQGNLRRAATRLGVTDRALQLRRANRQPTD